jgi:hypothetical protein
LIKDRRNIRINAWEDFGFFARKKAGEKIEENMMKGERRKKERKSGIKMGKKE